MDVAVDDRDAAAFGADAGVDARVAVAFGADVFVARFAALAGLAARFLVGADAFFDADRFFMAAHGTAALARGSIRAPQDLTLSRPAVYGARVSRPPDDEPRWEISEEDAGWDLAAEVAPLEEDSRAVPPS
ncbi:MAG TPA: hypothetical protein VNN07_12890, partial [Candidatus Tectomicrobia bacterium]|nr:hypothetical protein [Candidatus Tectomicrobia bacterium]